jgi:hypothetical protein
VRKIEKREKAREKTLRECERKAEGKERNDIPERERERE